MALNFELVDEIFDDYIKEMSKLGKTLVDWMEKIFGLAGGSLTKAYGKGKIHEQ